MKKLKLPFKAVKVKYVERRYKHLKPEKLTILLAIGKVKAVAKKYPKAVVVGADTLVVINNIVLGKPNSHKNTFKMLKMLNNQTCKIYTGLVVYNGQNRKMFSYVKTAKVVFKNNPDSVLLKYAQTKEPMDKAGAFAIQDQGRKLIKKIIGDRDSVIGLPVRELKLILKQI